VDPGRESFLLNCVTFLLTLPSLGIFSLGGACWPLTKFWEFLGHVDLFWDFDSLSKEERKTKRRSWDLGPLLGPFWVFGIM
jgi:hypothetical protein